MPLALLVIGVLIAVSAFRNTHKDLGNLVVGDLTGSGNFLYWVGAIVIVGALGYAPRFQTTAKVFIALIIIAMFLANGGVWQQLKDAISQAQAAQTGTTAEPLFKDAPTVNVNGNSSGGKSSSDPLGTALGVAKAVIPLILGG